MGQDPVQVWPSDFIRAVPLDDIRIRKGGTGRTVEAYAAIFDEQAEIVDQDGHYYERNAPTAFTRTIAHRSGRFPVVYHHGLTIAGTPSERGSVPIGVSTEVRPDAKGLLTVSEYSRSALADEVLEAIRVGAVAAQSYGGRFVKSDPRRPPGAGFRPDAGGKLRTVTRLEVAMHEFGPTPFPAFAGAAITGVRAQQMLGALLGASTEQRLAMLAEIEGLATPLPADPADPEDGTPDPGPAEQTDDSREHSARSLRARIHAARIARGMGV
jgi:HK97 family phage prohead protease